MNQNKLLNTTIEILSNQGAEPAYNYMLHNQNNVIDSNRSQVYNFLYCLAAVTGKKEEALSWLEEAVVVNKYWYRPEVFNDSDLDSLVGEERFERIKTISEKRYLEAKKTAKTQCTWTNKTRNNILIALHGNQQNIEMCKKHWEFMKDNDYQVEYLKSCELDSYELYRWEDDGNGELQLNNICEEIDWSNYDKRILGGFSSGCNVILKAILENKINCEYIILQSPWIPIINEKAEELISVLEHGKIKILLICGDCDEDCTPLAQTLQHKATEKKIDINTVWIKGLSHDFPDNFQEIVSEYIYGM
jgi:hypothetical protein